MKILADESVDKQIVEQLRKDGHEVDYVAESTPGISDPEVLNRANELNALLVTADKDFGELVFQQLWASSTGIVLLRLSGMSAEMKAQLFPRRFRNKVKPLLRASVSLPQDGSEYCRKLS